MTQFWTGFLVGLLATFVLLIICAAVFGKRDRPNDHEGDDDGHYYRHRGAK
jgi:hypothetical protein